VSAERVAELLELALQMPTRERAALLAELSAEDPALARELDSLLAVEEAAPFGLDDLAARVIPQVLQGIAGDLGESVPRVGSTVGRYRILDRIGGGGMGVVFRALDPELDRLVALKFLPGHLTGDPAARARFRREARAASALDHPNIAVVHEVGIVQAASDGFEQDRLFIAMAHYSGETLEQKIARGPLQIGEATEYGIQLASGLAAAHAAGIVHRDIKPANVIVTDDGRLRILDFGIAKLSGTDETREGSTLGTAAYMSPEQTRGEGIDSRTDIWSLGVVLFEMLSGVRPFRGLGEAVIYGIRNDDPAPLTALRPDVPVEFAQIVERCLARDPSTRYPSAETLLNALVALADGPGRPDAASERVQGHDTPSFAAWREGAVQRRVPRAARVGVPLFLLFTGSALWLRAGWGGGAPGEAATLVPQLGETRVAVIPFTPVTSDPQLEQLGRDLVVTLTAGLDGMGDIRAVAASTTLSVAEPRPGITLADAHSLARQLAADRVIHGVLTRAGTGVRLAVSLHDTGVAEPIASALVLGTNADFLSDALIITLLDELWRREPPPVPSLDALTRSQVPAARRAYLEAERALSRAQMATAIAAFERAYAADTAFVWAYFRSLYPRTWRAMPAADSARVQRILDSRSQLSEPDRLVIEAMRLSRSLSERVARLKSITEFYPNYEPASWEYASALVHSGGYLGYGLDDVRVAIERVLAINPGFVPAWDQLHWVATVQGDTLTAARAGGEAERLAGDATDRLRIRHPVSALVGSGHLTDQALEDSTVALLLRPDVGLGAASAFVAAGAPARQIQIGRAARERTADPTLISALWRAEALSWAARGAWDSAFVAADHWVRSARATDAGATLGAFRLAVAGVLLNAADPAGAARRRPAAARALARWSEGTETDCQTPAAELGPTRQPLISPSGRQRCEAQWVQATLRGSELVWLDGLLAYLERDPQGIERARRTLRGDPSEDGLAGRPVVSIWDSISRPMLDRSLGALALDLEGERARASGELIAVETEIANRVAAGRVGMDFPLLPIANRLLAAGWLRSLGGDADAERLLHWFDASLLDPQVEAWNRAIGSISLLDRAEIAESAGDAARALRDYRRFLQMYDLADPALRPLVERAAAGVGRLKPHSRP
jgi:TolB-like protein